MVYGVPLDFIDKALTKQQKEGLFIRWYIQRHITKSRPVWEQCIEVAVWLTRKGYLITPKTVKHYYYKDSKAHSE